MAGKQNPSKRKLLTISDELQSEIKAFRHEFHFDNESEAIRTLITLGLRSAKLSKGKVFKGLRESAFLSIEEFASIIEVSSKLYRIMEEDNMGLPQMKAQTTDGVTADMRALMRAWHADQIAMDNPERFEQYQELAKANALATQPKPE